MRKWVTILLAAVTLCVAVIAFGVWQFNRLLSEFHLDNFKFHVRSVNQHTLRFSDISVSQRTEAQQRTINLNDLTISWTWNRLSPHLDKVTIDAARIDQTFTKQDSELSSESQFSVDLPESWPNPADFPNQVRINHFVVTLPCSTGSCAITGALEMSAVKSGDITSAINVGLAASPGETFNNIKPARLLASYKSDALTTQLSLSADSPTTIPIPQLGELSGKANLELKVSANKIEVFNADGNIEINHLIMPESVRAKGLDAQSVSLRFQTQTSNGVSVTTFPVDISGQTREGLESQFSGRVIIDTVAKKILIEKFAVKASAPKFAPMNAIELSHLNLDLQASGYFQFGDKGQPDPFELIFDAPSQFSMDIDAKSFLTKVKTLRINVNAFKIHGDLIQNSLALPSVNINGEAAIAIANLSHPQVNDAAWSWQGKFGGTGDNIAVEGTLIGAKSLTVQHQLKVTPAEIKMDWRIPDHFLLASNPFAKLIKSCPPLLTLTRGKLNAAGSLTFDLKNDVLSKSRAELHLIELTGIYDTLAFAGLSSNIDIHSNGDAIQLTTSELEINELNKGFVFGPVVIAGDYQTHWDKLLQGKFSLARFDATAMDGNITTSAQVFDFSLDTQRVILQLKNIDLAKLLMQHSADELSGTGRLSGMVPVDIKGTSFRIVEGVVAAEDPGGQLKYSSTRTREIAKSQPSMKLVMDALSDFQYSLLSSKVNYDETGKLLLSVRLEGKNPAIENGRPIHFNVNLEEDVPAMLASIQLGSKVNDIIQKRLQQRLQKRDAQKSTKDIKN